MDYKDIYYKNYYEIDDDFIFNLKDFDKYKSNFLFTRNFAIITAFNPQNELLSCIENQDRHMLLRKDIEKLELQYLYARGFLDEHSEDGYLIYDINFQEAINLALKYEQYAIFYNNYKDRKIGYYTCNSKLPIVEISC
ncbi:DUF3293 domain-containing protein [Arcobacter roscoffensis]|uniref:DUF3293 domain-containing protein n=1 Tax=Arcobacter roscoffensis TaxID=2961520 RepID=A0ABY5E130_9BACT|nr:DUF3293 domain-containing protein [Arcobacter roscoffensis]UTJ05896.1 DUF3293 domain-containing protein [Arcobacter roscoffensis]